MNEKCTKMNKWRDEAGNVYTVEQSARNKRFVVIVMVLGLLAIGSAVYGTLAR